MIEFFVEGKPVGKQRPRVVKRGQSLVAYTPKKTKDYELKVQVLALNARNKKQIYAPIGDEVEVIIEIYSENKKQPDIDNVVKSILDGMNKIVYVDDAQVKFVSCERFNACGTGLNGVAVKVVF